MPDEPKRRRGRPSLQEGVSSTPICIRVPDPLYDKTERKATTERVSVPELVRRALTQLLDDKHG